MFVCVWLPPALASPCCVWLPPTNTHRLIERERECVRVCVSASAVALNDRHLASALALNDRHLS